MRSNKNANMAIDSQAFFAFAARTLVPTMKSVLTKSKSCLMHSHIHVHIYMLCSLFMTENGKSIERLQQQCKTKKNTLRNWFGCGEQREKYGFLCHCEPTFTVDSMDVIFSPRLYEFCGICDLFTLFPSSTSLSSASQLSNHQCNLKCVQTPLHIECGPQNEHEWTSFGIGMAKNRNP